MKALGLAHELGHNMGQHHVACTSGFDEPPFAAYPYPNGIIGGAVGSTTRYFGLDLGATSLLLPPSVHLGAEFDLMSYCTPRWISDFTWGIVHDTIENGTGFAFHWHSPESVVAGPGIGIATPKYITGDFLLVAGVLNSARTGLEWSEAWRLDEVGEVPLRSNGSYHLRLLGAQGVLVADYSFAVTALSDDATRAEFSIVVPYAIGTERIVVNSATGVELKSWSVAAGAPSVSSFSRTGGPVLGTHDSVVLRWTSDSVAHEPLTYVLLYSSDGGFTWRVTQVGDSLMSAFVSADASLLPGTHGAAMGQFRIVVHGNVLTSSADSDLFEVEGKPPVARIMSPTSGSEVAYGQPIVLQGEGLDLEEGSIDDSALIWTSNRDGSLGTGGLVHPKFLSVGIHQITLVATDSDGLRGMATVTVTVAPKLIADGIAPRVNCGQLDQLWHNADVSLECTASDSQTGLASSADAAFSLVTAVPAGSETTAATTSSRRVCDRAGNCSAVGPFGPAKVDKKEPSIALASPVGGMQYLLGEAIPAFYSCSDLGSGLNSCAGTVLSGAAIDTATVGPKLFEVVSVDRVENISREQRTYSVIFKFDGFLGPVHGLTSLHVMNAGAALPIKFSLGAFQGQSPIAPGFPQSIAINCDGSAIIGAVGAPTVSPGLSSIQYDGLSDMYTYLWKTDRSWALTCRRFVLKLSDGTVHALDVSLR